MGLVRRIVRRLIQAIKHFKNNITKKILREAPTHYQPLAYLPELTAEERDFLNSLVNDNLTMTTIENLAGTLLAAKYIARYGIEGDYFECGVWRGGHAICFAETMTNEKRNVKLYLLDTFQGMVRPSDKDIRLNDSVSASNIWKDKERKGLQWCFATLEEVKGNIRRYLGSTQNELIQFVFLKGRSQDILIKDIDLPKSIAFLRLDTDWYDSTIVELERLWPRVVEGGILVIDDYGYWKGQKEAVDNFFADKPVFLIPLSGGSRICQKLAK